MTDHNVYTSTNHQLGYNPTIEKTLKEKQLQNLTLARVIAEHRERYTVRNNNGEFDAEIIGNLRFTASSKSDFPSVGDWVAIAEHDDFAFIHKIAYRKKVLKRQGAGKSVEEQIIATNVDTAFIVESANRDHNLNRIERYLTICYEAGVEPILVLNKVDLIKENSLKQLLKEFDERIPNVTVVPTSCQDEKGLHSLYDFIKFGKTYCFLGSSGVGKSSIINYLVKDEKMATQSIGELNNRGKHTTTHRELIVLPSGGVLIDNPGMREVGMTSVEEGISSSFSQIDELAEECRYNDCSHQHEKGCAVLAAIQSGELSMASYQNYLKLEKETQHYLGNVAEKRKKGKAFSKMVKQAKGLKPWRLEK